MQRENKKRRRDQVTEEKTSAKCAKKMHQNNTDKNNRPDRESDEVIGVFDFPWIKDGTMFSTAISEDDWYFEGTFLASLRAAIEDQGEFFSQFSCSAAAGGLLLEFLPEIDNRVGDESSSVTNVDNSIWASVLNQPLGRV